MNRNMYEIANNQNEEEQSDEVDAGEGTSQSVVADQIDDLCNSIFDAAEIGEMSQIKSFVDQGVNVNVKNENGFTPLHIASKAGKAECVKLLIEYGGNIDDKEINNKTAIHLACENNHLDVVLALINKGANFEAKDLDEETPLNYAAKSGSETIVRLLLKTGADMNTLDWDEYPVLSKVNKTNILNIFLEAGYDYKKITHGRTILHVAAEYDNAVLADFIFEKQINVNIQEKDDCSKTAMLLAAEFNSWNVMEVLLRNGANIEDSDYVGYNVLYTAIVCNSYEAVKLLLENNANVNAHPKGIRTSTLIVAAQKNYLEITRLLLSYKVDVKFKDKTSRTALDYANQFNFPEIVNILNPYYTQ